MERLEKMETLMSIGQSKQSSRNGPLQFYDIDYTGGQMEKILEITAEPISEQQIKKQQERELWQARNQNEYCHACKEGGDLLCCDSCPAAFHLQCCNPPLDEEKAPSQDAEWACHRCVIIGNGNIDNKSLKHRLTPQTIEFLKSSNKFQDKIKGKSLGSQYLIQRSSLSKSRKAAQKASEEPQKEDGQKTCFSELLGGEVFENTQLFTFDYPHLIAAPLPDTKKKRVEKRGRKPNDPDAVMSVARKLCFNCERNSRAGPMIQCDFCPIAYHFDCLDPPIMQLSGKKWMCPLHPQKNLLEPSVTQSFAKRVEIQNYFQRPINPQQIKINFIKKANAQTKFHPSKPRELGHHHYSNVHVSVKAAYQQFRHPPSTTTFSLPPEDTPGCSATTEVESSELETKPSAAVAGAGVVEVEEEGKVEQQPANDGDLEQNKGDVPCAIEAKVEEEVSTPDDVAMEISISSSDVKMQVEETIESDATFGGRTAPTTMDEAKELVRKLMFGPGSNSSMMQEAIRSVMSDNAMLKPLPDLSVNEKLELKRKEMSEAGFPVRAILIDVTHNRRYYIYEDQLTIGRCPTCTIHLPDQKKCNRITPVHARIFYDKPTDQWELLSDGSTYVDGYHYGLDFVTPFQEEDSPIHISSKDNFVQLLRKVLKKENKDGTEFPIAPTPENVTRQFPIAPCKCAKKLIEPGWEGPAALVHGSVVKIGCIELVFALMDHDRKDQYNYRQFTEKRRESLMLTDCDEYTDSCSEKEPALEEPKHDPRVKKRKSKKVLDAMKEKTATKRKKKPKTEPGETPTAARVTKVNGQTKHKNKASAPGDGSVKEKKPRRYKAKRLPKATAASTTTVTGTDIAVGQIIASPSKTATNITTGELKEHQTPKIASKLNKKKVFHHPLAPAAASTSTSSTSAATSHSKFNGSAAASAQFNNSSNKGSFNETTSRSPKKRTGTTTSSALNNRNNKDLNFGFAALSEQQFLHHMPEPDVYDMEPKNSALCGTSESVSLSDRSSSSRMDDLINKLEEGAV